MQGTGVANSIGRYFSVVSFIPSFAICAICLPIGCVGQLAPIQPELEPRFHIAWPYLVSMASPSSHSSVSDSVSVIHPIQFAIVQFFEGYWGTRSITQRARYQRIVRYSRLCERLDQDIDSVELISLPNGKKQDFSTRLSVSAPHSFPNRDEAESSSTAHFPTNLDEVMPTRLGNVLRRAESQAGSQYGIKALAGHSSPPVDCSG